MWYKSVELREDDVHMFIFTLFYSITLSSLHVYVNLELFPERIETNVGF